MTTPLALTIVGNATLYRRAERAVVTIRIRSEGPSQKDVSKEVTERSNELRATLKEMALKSETGEAAPEAPITHWSMKTLSTGSSTPRDNTGKKLAVEYHANTTFSARFRDFTELGSFAGMVSTMKNVNVQQIAWELTDATKDGLATKSRVAAVNNAIAQAKDFSAALGRGEVTATEVIGGSSGVNMNQYYASHGHGHGGYRGGGAGAGGEELNFEPENVSFSCNVTVKFKAA